MRAKMSSENWAEAKSLREDHRWSIAAIADYFGITERQISTRAKLDSWKEPATVEKDQSEMRRQVQAKAEEKAMEFAATQLNIRLDELTTDARRDAIVEAQAIEVSRVMTLHRSGATRTRELVSRLFNELQFASIPEADLMRLVEIVAKEDTQGIETEATARRIERQTIQAFRGLLGLDSRADIAKKLVDAMVKVVELERKVYGIKDEVSEGDIAKALKELSDGE